VNVAIVFAPDFSGRLHQLAFHTPVWIVETPENRAAAEEAWMRRQEWPHIDVTVFDSAQDLPIVLELVDLHHEADSVEVIGIALTERTREAFVEAGFQRIEETAEGIRARKT
jgi:hypothetical protein